MATRLLSPTARRNLLASLQPDTNYDIRVRAKDNQGAYSRLCNDNGLRPKAKPKTFKKLWSRLMGSSNFDYPSGISTDSAGNSYMVGQSYGDFDGHRNSGGYDAFIVKSDSSGNKIWSKLMGTSGEDSARSVSTDSAGTYLYDGLLFWRF